MERRKRNQLTPIRTETIPIQWAPALQAIYLDYSLTVLGLVIKPYTIGEKNSYA